MKIAVKPHILIPHEVFYKGQTISFNPTAEVPEDLGKPMLANAPETYYEVDKEIGTDGYKIKDSFQGKTAGEIIEQLTRANQIKIIALARKILDEEKNAASFAEARAKKAAEKEAEEADKNLPGRKK